MNNNALSYKLFFLAFVFIISLCISLYYSSLNAISNKITCWGKVETITSQFRFNALFTYVFKGKGVGVVVYDGVLTSNDDKKSRKVGMKILFSYKEAGNNIFIFNSNVVSILPGAEEGFTTKNFIPEFYRNKNVTYNVGIYKVNEGGYLFVDAQLPFLLCQTKNNGDSSN